MSNKLQIELRKMISFDYENHVDYFEVHILTNDQRGCNEINFAYRLRGQSRNEIGRLVNDKGASFVYFDTIANTSIERLQQFGRTVVPSQVALRREATEYRQSSRFHPDDYEDVIITEKAIRKVDDSKIIPGFIRSADSLQNMFIFIARRCSKLLGNQAKKIYTWTLLEV